MHSVAASFNTATVQMTEMSQWPRYKWPKSLSDHGANGTNDRNVSVTKRSQRKNDRNVSSKKKAAFDQQRCCALWSFFSLSHKTDCIVMPAVISRRSVDRDYLSVKTVKQLFQTSHTNEQKPHHRLRISTMPLLEAKHFLSSKVSRPLQCMNAKYEATVVSLLLCLSEAEQVFLNGCLSRIREWLFHSLLCSKRLKGSMFRTRRSSYFAQLSDIGVISGPWPPKFLRYLIILCFEKWCPKQNTVSLPKSTIFPQKNFGLATPLLSEAAQCTTLNICPQEPKQLAPTYFLRGPGIICTRTTCSIFTSGYVCRGFTTGHETNFVTVK